MMIMMMFDDDHGHDDDDGHDDDHDDDDQKEDSKSELLRCQLICFIRSSIIVYTVLHQAGNS